MDLLGSILDSMQKPPKTSNSKQELMAKSINYFSIISLNYLI
jgi:hypothetical protein